MSDRSPGPSALRRCTQRCPLQRNSPKEKTAEEGDLSSSVLDKALSSNSAQAPGLIMGAEQSRVRTKQVLCNQQLAVACDGLQSQPELSLLHAYTNTHKLNTASAVHTHMHTLSTTNKTHSFGRTGTIWRLNILIFNLISPPSPHLCPAPPLLPFSLCTITGLLALLPLIPPSHSFVRSARGV